MKKVSKILKVTLIIGLCMMGMLCISSKANAATKVTVAKVKAIKVKDVTTTGGTVYWSKVRGAKGYVLYKYNTKKKKYSTKVTTTTKTSYTVKNLSAGTNNWYRVIAYKTVNKKNYFATPSNGVRLLTKPKRVTGVKKVSVTNSTIKLSWSKLSSADGYVIYSYNSSTKKYTNLGKTTSTRYTINKLKDATMYTFVVKAYSVSSKVYSYGAISSKVSIYTRPNAVVKVSQAKTGTEDSVTITWPKVRKTNGYRIYLFDGEKDCWNLLSEVSPSTEKYVINNLKAGEAYDIMVRTYILDENKLKLYDKGYDIIEVLTMPGPVSKIAATKSKIKETELTLSWTGVYGATGYYVERYNPTTGQYVRLGKTSSTRYVVKGLEGVTDYKFRVISYKYYQVTKREYVSNSSVKTINVMTKLGNPDNINVDNKTKKSISFKWDKVNNATGYNVCIYDNEGKLLKTETIATNTYAYTVPTEQIINIKIQVEAYFVKTQTGEVGSQPEKIYSEKVTLDATNAIDKVTGLERYSYGEDYLGISWKKVSYADKYEIFLKKSEDYEKVAETTDTKYTFKNLDAGKYYTYSVRAVKMHDSEELRSDYSEDLECITKHVAPKVTVSYNGINYLTLSWNKIDNVSGYKVYKLNEESGEYELYANVGSSTTTYKDKGIKRGESYKYKVRAYKVINDLAFYGLQCDAVIGVVGTYGIDVSQWQGNIDWNKVKASGVDYAIIRATTKSTSNGENGTYLKMDTKFKRNMKNAIAAGIKVGVYVYSYATSVSQAKKEAELVLKYVEPYKLTYPIYFDIEDPSRAKTSLKTENTNMTIAFCDTVKAEGYTPGVYSGASYFTKYLNIGSISKYDIWVARYIRTGEYKFPSHLENINDYLTLTHQYGGKYTSIKADMWQYSSNGIVRGINGRVDMNYSYKSY